MKYVSGRYTQGQVATHLFEAEDALTRVALAGTGLVISDDDIKQSFINQIHDLSMGRNEVVFDDNNRPSVYTIYRPDEKARLDYLNNGGTHFTKGGNELHPAFIVNGNVVELLIGKYLAGRVGGTNYGVSLRGLEPAHTISLDSSMTLCSGKGTGHHLMTQAEWAYLMLLALREGYQPRGNDSYGKSYQDSTEKAEAIDQYDSSGTQYIGRTLTGSGPLSWSLDGSPFAPMDLRGNVREWNSGYRIKDGELQVLANNNAADSTKDQGVDSVLWKAILQSGLLAAPGIADTYKWDFDSAPTANGAAYSLNITIENSSADYYGQKTFSALTAKDGVVVHDLLRILGLMPTLANAALGIQYMRNVGERFGGAGGDWGSPSVAGLGYRNASTERSYTNGGIGFRSALYRRLNT